jgi:hypothetical protein
MLNFIEILRDAQNGQAIDNFAGNFGLSEEQTRQAIAALLPAFAVGFQQAQSRPDHLRDLTDAMARGVYAPFFESAARAYSRDARKRGEEALAALFGSPDLARDLAGRSAELAGLSRETLNTMMPYLASTLMGGVENKANVRKPKTEEANPYEAMFSAMFGVEPEPEPAPPPKSETEQAVEAMFGQWEQFLRLGREMQDTQMRMLRSMFDEAARHLDTATKHDGKGDSGDAPATNKGGEGDVGADGDKPL